MTRADIRSIANNPGQPTFENTVEALERCCEPLARLANVLLNLGSAHKTPELQPIDQEISPAIANLRTEILSNDALFARIDHLMGSRQRQPDERGRVLDLLHRKFLRSGARLDGSQKARLAQIRQRLVELGLVFSQNLLAGQNSFVLPVHAESALAGLPKFVLADLRRAAEQRGLEAKYGITLSQSLVDALERFSSDRDLRQRVYRAWDQRDRGGERNNDSVAREMLALRQEEARLLGFPTFAHLALADNMAENPEAVGTFLARILGPVLARAQGEVSEAQSAAQRVGADFAIEPWDLRYYAEHVRRQKYDFDEQEVRPYFQLDKLIEAAFFVANRLFGLTFVSLPQAPRYHPQVRVWAVHRNGAQIGLLLGDYFARPSKESGSWTGTYQEQHKLAGDVQPIVVNVLNIIFPGSGRKVLLSWEEARTVFHEFGHALHALLSNVTYPLLSWLNVPRDFIEFPSKLLENWVEQPEVLRRFALHLETGEPIPDRLLHKLLAAGRFGKACFTMERTASAMLDLRLHLREADGGNDFAGFEASLRQELGMPEAVAFRFRVPNFNHVFSSTGFYAAGYYTYLWSEMLAADAFRAFEEAGSIFDADVSGRLYKRIFSTGALVPAEAAYTSFRGAFPLLRP